MKTIGLLGGTGWSSTIVYYKLINELVAERLGGFHSAKILLKSIDYHDIMTHYGKNHNEIAAILKRELADFLALKPECIIICCNSLHKYFDFINQDLVLTVPVFHAVELVAENLIKNKQKQALLLATKFTMEDGFFANILEKKGIDIVIPNQQKRNEMQKIHQQLMQNKVTEEAKNYFASLVKEHAHLDVVILGCTEYTLVIDQANSAIPIVDPVFLQASCAIDYALNAK